jgi:hypothetical protein
MARHRSPNDVTYAWDGATSTHVPVDVTPSGASSGRHDLLAVSLRAPVHALLSILRRWSAR